MMTIRELTLDASKVDENLLNFVIDILRKVDNSEDCSQDDYNHMLDFFIDNYKQQENAVKRLRMLKSYMESMWAANRIKITDMEAFMDRLHDLGLPFDSENNRVA